MHRRVTFKFIIVAKFMIITKLKALTSFEKVKGHHRHLSKSNLAFRRPETAWALRWKLWFDVQTHPYLSCLELICPS